MHAGNFITAQRRGAGVNQYQLAERCGVGQSTVSRWERSTRISTEILEIVAKALNKQLLIEFVEVAEDENVEEPEIEPRFMTKKPDPTPEEIKHSTAEIRARWDKEEWKKRAKAHGHVEEWEPPVVKRPNTGER